MSNNEAEEAVSVVSFISRSLEVYKWNPDSKVWIIISTLRIIINIFVVSWLEFKQFNMYI